MLKHNLRLLRRNQHDLRGGRVGPDGCLGNRSDRKTARGAEHDAILLALAQTSRHGFSMGGADSFVVRLVRVVGDIPEVAPYRLFELRRLSSASVRVRPTADLVQHIAIPGFLVFAKDTAEKTNRRRSVHVRLFDVFFVEFDDPEVNVDQVAFDIERARFVDRGSLVVDFDKLNCRSRSLGFRVRDLVNHRQLGHTVINLEQM